MKKRILKICCVWLILVATIFGMVYAKTVDTKEINETKKVLANQERKRLTYEEPKEEIIGECFETKEQIVNEKSNKLLDYLQVSLDENEKINIVQKEEKQVKRLVDNNYKVEFNKNGDIVKITNYDDLFIKGRIRTDYSENETIEKVEYQYSSQESIEPIINEIYDDLGLEQYKIVSCHNQLEGTWFVLWNKVMENGVVNPFDAVAVTIDARDGSIMAFDRNAETPDCNILMISKEKALEYAQSIIKEIGEYNELTSDLTVVRPNFYWEEGGPYENADFIRIAWNFKCDDIAEVYVDAETGEILGGSETFGEGYRSISTDPNGIGVGEMVNLAAQAFQRLRIL